MYTVNEYDMAQPQNHSIPKATLCLQPRQYRFTIMIRGVCQKNKNQAENHLKICKNIESLSCNCHLIQ